jgi:hypothetical protein
LAFGVAATLIYLVIGEILVRLATHSPLLEFPDFRAARGERNNLNQAIEYEPLVGWTLKPFLATQDFNTIEYGLRSNGGAETRGRLDGIMAVGSSFTAGSEVPDGDTWSAHLERLVGLPVNNAGVGNYSADQIIMRAEQLMPVLRPKLILVDLLADNILGAGYSSYAFPKPYFLVEKGELVAHNQPVPLPSEPVHDPFAIKAFLAHSIIIDRFMTAFFSDQWFSSNRGGFTRTNSDEVEVTCRLLDRLKRKTDEAGVRLILYLQFAGSHVMGQKKPPGHTSLVKECAENFGIQVADEFAQLKSAYERNPEELRSYYVREVDGSTGHKSSFGNLQVAKLIQDTINETPPIQRVQQTYLDAAVSAEEFTSDAKNLVPDSEDLDRSISIPPHVNFKCVFNWFSGSRTYQVSATGGSGEHYVAIGGIPVTGGSVITSVEIKAEGTSRARIQLVSESGNGAFTDVNLDRAAFVTTRFAETRGVGAGMESLMFGWYRVWLKAFLPPGEGKATVFLQLVDEGDQTRFEPKKESVLVRRIQLVRGREPTRYQSPSGGFMRSWCDRPKES